MALCRLWLQNLKTSAAAFEGVPLAWPWCLPRPHKLFLLGFETATCGTFWAGLKSLKTSAAAFEGRAFQGVPLAWPWCLPRLHKLFLLGFTTAVWHVLGRPQKPLPLAWPWCLPRAPQAVSLGLRNCYVARFGQALKASKPPQQLSKAL